MLGKCHQACFGHTRTLQVSGRLAERNRRLRAAHGQLGRVVVGLMETDLVRHKDRCGAVCLHVCVRGPGGGAMPCRQGHAK